MGPVCFWAVMVRDESYSSYPAIVGDNDNHPFDMHICSDYIDVDSVGVRVHQISISGATGNLSFLQLLRLQSKMVIAISV